MKSRRLLSLLCATVMVTSAVTACGPAADGGASTGSTAVDTGDTGADTGDTGADTGDTGADTGATEGKEYSDGEIVNWTFFGGILGC